MLIRRIYQLSLILITTFILIGCQTQQSYEYLWQYYQDYFPIGATFSQYSIDGYRDGLAAHFNSMTLENEMKWIELQPSEGVFNFDMADSMLELSERHNMLVRGHTLVWHEGLPNWVLRNSDQTLVDKETALSRMRTHIYEVMMHFGNTVYAWDVVNEVIEDGNIPLNEEKSNIYRQSDWFNVTGTDFIKEAFIYARQVADENNLDVKLFYNDYGNESPAKREKTIAMLEWLIEENVPIDGIGIQGHYNIGSIDIDEISRTIDMYAELGLEVQITELDINVYDDQNNLAETQNYQNWYHNGLPSSVEEIQTAYYRRLFEVYRSKAAITNVTFWGVADDYTWLDQMPYLNRKNYPFIFDVYHEKKSSYEAITAFRGGQ